MIEASGAIGRTVRAGLAGWAPTVRANTAALIVGALISAAALGLPSGLSWLDLSLQFIAGALAIGASYRLAFGGPRGWRGLTWSRAESGVLGVQLLTVAVLLIVAGVLLVVLGGVTLGLARSAAPNFDATSPDAWRAALAGRRLLLGALLLAGFLLIYWIAFRLTLASAATVDTGRLQVLSTFAMTRGRILPMFIAGLVVLTPTLLVLTILHFASDLAEVPAAMRAWVQRAASAVMIYFYLTPVWTAALVDVYRQARPTPLGTSVP